ncbi:hypothetical protein P8452_19359 [Trifolium repens]|nr:hypothetical protein P8452_19359 [Trifolium repens]
MFKLRDKKTSIHSFAFKSGRSSHFTQKQYNRIFKTVMQYGVQNLNFNMSNKIRITKLPPRIFGLKMLQVLTLTNILMGDFDQVNFPHLKTLHLNSVWFKNHEYFVNFLFGCPILEKLESWLYFNNHQRHHISKDLNILPNLVEIRISGVNTPMALVCNAKVLHLEKMRWMKWTELPMFHNLIHLEINFDAMTFEDECSSLLGILPHFPKLQHFNIQDNAGALSKHFKCWIDPSTVSECLSSKLKTCCIRGYKGTEYEFGLAKYIMQHSKVLETITIKCAWLKQNTWLSKRHMRLKLSSCTMGSTTCKLLFY